MRRGDGVFGPLFNVVMIALVLLYGLSLTSGGVALGSGRAAPQIRDLLWFALVCGVAAFATIEILKRLVQVRGYYQLRQTRAWLDQRGGPGAFDELLTAMSGARLRSADVLRVFNLPTELLVAQISAAAELALTDPDVEYKALRRALSGKVSVDDGGGAHDGASYDGGVHERELLVARRTRSSVDQLQISLGERWRRYVEGAAIWISGAYGVALIASGSVHHAGERRYVFAALLVGGAIAWIIRDLTAIAERARR